MTESRAQGRTATAATQLTGRRSRARCQRGIPANRLATRCSTEAAAQRPMADPVRPTQTRTRRSASGHPCESRDPSTSWQRSQPERQPQLPKRPQPEQPPPMTPGGRWGSEGAKTPSEATAKATMRPRMSARLMRVSSYVAAGFTLAATEILMKEAVRPFHVPDVTSTSM